MADARMRQRKICAQLFWTRRPGIPRSRNKSTAGADKKKRIEKLLPQSFF